MPRRRLWLAVGVLGGSSVATQLALMRELLAALGGNELVLGVCLGNWLLLTGLGAVLARRAGGWRHPGRRLAVAQLLAAVLPPAQLVLLRLLRDVLLVRGADAGAMEAVAGSLLALAPFCLVSGGMLTLACTLLAPRGGAPGAAEEGGAGTGRALGSAYLADALGSVAGGLAFTFVLVLWLDHFRILCLAGLLNLASAALLASALRRRWVLGAALASGAVLGVAGWGLDVDARLTAAQYPGQRVVHRGQSPCGRLVVTEAAGQLNFLLNGLPVFSTENSLQVEESVHYAMIQRPSARRVLLISGGIVGTAREILKYGVGEVVYVELDPQLVEAGGRFLPRALADPRIRLRIGDGRREVQQAAARYDVILVDLPDPSTSQLNRFYTREFFQEARRALVPGGVLAFGLGHYENYVGRELGAVLACGRQTLASVFAHTLLLPGGRVFFLGSDGTLWRDVGARLAAAGIPVQWLSAHYLDATLSPARLEAVQGASDPSARINRDFSPVLYLRHLAHWLSQFQFRWIGVAVVAAVGLVLYLAFLPAAPTMLFASGFALSALELVLLLVFQVLYGSVYRQVGLAVTLCMAGLAGGAWLGLRWTGAGACRALGAFGLALAAVVAAVPAVFPWLARIAASPGLSAAGAVAIPALLFGLSVLVGAQFPLAGQVARGGAARAAARLYCADLAGASLGALLTSAWLAPALGLAPVCFLAAGANLAAAARLWRTRLPKGPRPLT